MCPNPKTILYFGLSWGVQAGRLAPGLENPILEAGPKYYISLYAPFKVLEEGPPLGELRH